MKPDAYNLERMQSGAVTISDITALVVAAQRELGVKPDGFAGPVTIAAARGELNPYASGTR